MLEVPEHFNIQYFKVPDALKLLRNILPLPKSRNLTFCTLYFHGGMASGKRFQPIDAFPQHFFAEQTFALSPPHHGGRAVHLGYLVLVVCVTTIYEDNDPSQENAMNNKGGPQKRIRMFKIRKGSSGKHTRYIIYIVHD